MVRLETVQLVLAVVQVRAPGDEVTVYPVTAAPPLSVGAVQDTVADPFPAAALTLVGVAGLVIATTNSGSTVSDTVILPSTVAFPSKVATESSIE